MFDFCFMLFFMQLHHMIIEVFIANDIPALGISVGINPANSAVDNRCCGSTLCLVQLLFNDIVIYLFSNVW